MARYDTQLNRERGAVRSGMNRDRSWYATDRSYSRDYGGFDRDAAYWRRPDQIRGYRGGAASSYGFGNDADLVDYQGQNSPVGPELGAGRQRRGSTGTRYDRNFFGDRFGVRGGYRARSTGAGYDTGYGATRGESRRWPTGYGRDYSERANNPRATGYDRGYGSNARPLRPNEPLAREIRDENARLVSDYRFREGLAGADRARRSWER